MSKKIFLVIVFFLLASIVTIGILSWTNINASYADIRCIPCHRELNRLIDIGEYDIMEPSLLPPIVFGEPLEKTLEIHKERNPWMCKDCLYSISYASSNNYPFEHPAWKGFVKVE